MAGTRTAPSVAGPSSGSLLTLYVIDNSGSLNTESFYVASDAALADIETFVANYQAGSESSVYRVDLAQQWRGDADVANATALYSVNDGINMLFEDQLLINSSSLRIYAPSTTLLIANTDNVNMASPVLTAIDATFRAIAFPAVSRWKAASYTERRDTNKRTRR